MIHNHPITEGVFVILAIKINPFFGAFASLSMAFYYSSMLKANIVDTRFDGSWKKYFKSFFKWK